MKTLRIDTKVDDIDYDCFINGGVLCVTLAPTDEDKFHTYCSVLPAEMFDNIITEMASEL